MQTYQHWHAVFTARAMGYPINACRTAIQMSERNLRMLCANNSEYEAAQIVKFQAKIDAMQSRIAQLQRNH